MATKTLNEIVKTNSAFSSFTELTEKTPTTYRPSLDQREPDLVRLANAYDERMIQKGDRRRAYRYGEPAIQNEPRPGTIIIGGIHVSLSFEEEGGRPVSSCFLTRNKQTSSLALVEDLGGIDGDDGFIPIPEDVINRITEWACLRGY